MTKIRKLLTALTISCLFFVASSLFAASANAAPRIYFDPATTTQTVGNDFQINVNVDVGTTSIFGADAIINYPSDGFTVKSINYGGFFSDNVTPVQSSGQIILRGSFFSSATGSGSGNGTFATITFNASKAAGTGNISFNCGGSNSTDIIDINGNNILSCSSLNQTTVTFSEGTTSVASPTPGTNQSGSTNGATNACGGTCGSAHNCNVNLFCYQGFCRNPDCPSSSTCGCASPTPSPTTAPRSTVKPTPKSTPVVVTLAKTTPIPSPLASLTPLPTILPTVGQSLVKPIYVWTILGLIAIIVIWIAINALKKKSPPKINPPTQGGQTIETYHVEPPTNPPFPPANY